jgi:hypothetical protein
MMTFFRRFKYVLLAALSCLWVMGVTPASVSLPLPAIASPAPLSPADLQSLTTQDLQANLQAAQQQLAQGTMAPRPFVRYVAIMSGSEIVPMAASTPAIGTVGAALAGNRLILRGSFRDLTSDLRDYETDPLDPPNPNITSAFHIHRGMPTENGPFQVALEVMLDDSINGGRVMGDVMLSDEQVTALETGMMYVDVHTTRFRGGELRGILMPA